MCVLQPAVAVLTSSPACQDRLTCAFEHELFPERPVCSLIQ